MDETEEQHETAVAESATVGRHLSKRSRKNKGLVVVFDANARKEFVTGFQKRKKKRRKLAEKQKQLKDREKRLQERRERRRALAEAVAETEARYDEVEDGSEELLSDQNEWDKGGVQKGTVMYEDDVMTTVVNTYSITMDADVAAHDGPPELGKASSASLQPLQKRLLAKKKQLKSKLKPKRSGKKRKLSLGSKGKHGPKRKKRK